MSTASLAFIVGMLGCALGIWSVWDFFLFSCICVVVVQSVLLVIEVRRLK